MEETAKNPLGTERIGKLMVRFAVPSIIALVINSIYSVVDQIVIGNGVENSDIAIAATNVILPL
ncbi:MAG: MATE family efflux transporter, partial [Treponemataceae bacterium]|nr:MATE family efflux transporter [Treponemataceae bacterium]